MASVTYKVPVGPTKGKKGKLTYETRTGDVVWCTVGEERIKCTLQKHDGKTELVHYASGWRIIHGNTIEALKLEYYVNSGGCTMSDRIAAITALDRIMAQLGHEKVLDVITKAPVINA